MSSLVESLKCWSSLEKPMTKMISDACHRIEITIFGDVTATENVIIKFYWSLKIPKEQSCNDSLISAARRVATWQRHDEDLRLGPCHQRTDRMRWISHHQTSSVHRSTPTLHAPCDYDPLTQHINNSRLWFKWETNGVPNFRGWKMRTGQVSKSGKLGTGKCRTKTHGRL